MPEPTERKKTSAPPPEETTLTAAEQMARRVARSLRWALPLGSVALAVVVGLVYDAGLAVLVLALGVLIGIIAILWASVRTLSGDAPITLEEAVMLGATR